jgi:hypothetical protein
MNVMENIKVNYLKSALWICKCLKNWLKKHAEDNTSKVLPANSRTKN